MSLLWQWFRFGGPSQVSVSVLLQQKEQHRLSSALEPENAVLRGRHINILLEHPPKRTILCMQCRLRKFTKLCSRLFVTFATGLLPGLHKVLAQPKHRPTNLGTLPLKPKTFFVTKIMTQNSVVWKMRRQKRGCQLQIVDNEIVF